jgi:hypothetical protein
MKDVGNAAANQMYAGSDPAQLAASYERIQPGPSDGKTKRLREKKMAKKLLADEVLAMNKDPLSLGLGEAERQQVMASDIAAASAQRQAQQTELSRSMAGGQEFQTGAFADAQGQIARQASSSASQASTSANDLSQQLVEGRVSRARAALAADVERKRKLEAFWRDVGLQAAGVAVSLATGVPIAAFGASTGSKNASEDEEEALESAPEE